MPVPVRFRPGNDNLKKKSTFKSAHCRKLWVYRKVKGKISLYSPNPRQLSINILALFLWSFKKHSWSTIVYSSAFFWACVSMYMCVCVHVYGLSAWKYVYRYVCVCVYEYVLWNKHFFTSLKPFVFCFFMVYAFIHMCIHCLGHLSPLSPTPHPLPPIPLTSRQNLFCPLL
jgi:hypothetical protein